MQSKHMKNNNEEANLNRKKTKSNNNKIPKKKHKVLKRFILFIFIILIVLAAFFTWKVQNNGGGMKGVLTTVVGSDSKKQLDEIQFLLLGVNYPLTDTIMICSYNPNTQKANMVSVPRDTFVGDNKNRPTASDKINAQYAGKYPERSLEAVNKITGLNLEYYIVVDTDALTKLVDAIGGVDFYVPMDMSYHDYSEENYIMIDLKEGMQKLNGDQAEQLVRFRHNDDGSTYPEEYGGEDFGRMRTQREFISATLQQLLKPSNILKIGEIIDIASQSVKTNLSISNVKDYIPYAVEFNTENISTDYLPGNDHRPTSSSPYVYLLDEEESQKIICKHFFGGATEENLNPEMPNIQILNGSGDASILKGVVNSYKEKGYNVLMVGNNSKTVSKSSILNRTKELPDIATSVQEVLGVGTVTNGSKLDDIDFTIIIGKDYLNN